MKKKTLLELNRLIESADSLFARGARAWERGNQNGDDPAYNARCRKQMEACHDREEAMLTPLGIEVDYPGLYPSFKVRGFTFHTTESAVSAAMEGGSL